MRYWKQLRIFAYVALAVFGLGGSRIQIAQAIISNGANAIDLLGEYDQTSFTDPVPVYSKGGINDSANIFRLSPQGMAIDSTNHRLFVVDSTNNRVLVYTLTAGNLLADHRADSVLGQPNFYAKAVASTQSGLSDPTGIAFDSTNNRLYVSDYNNNRVVIYNTSSITDGMNAVNVLGQTTFSGTTGANTQPGMNGPYGLVFDSANSRLYVAGNINNRVTVYDTAAITNGENAVNVLGQTTFSGSTAQTTQKLMASPVALAYDSSNSRLYVAESINNRVTVFSVSVISNGENAVNVLGQTAFDVSTGAVTQPGMNSPRGLTFDSANNRLYVSQSTSANRVTVYDTAAITNGENAVNVLGQTAFDGVASATTQPGLTGPGHLAYDSTNSRLYVSDLGNYRVITYDVAAITNGENAVDLLGQYDETNFTDPVPIYDVGANSGANIFGFNAPYDVAIDGTNHRLFIAEYNNNRVVVYSLTAGNLLTDHVPDNVLGQVNFYSSSAATTQSGMYNPSAVEYDSINNRLYVASNASNRVTIYDVAAITNGENAVNVLGQTTFSGSGAATSQFEMSAPYGLAFDSSNNRLYVSENSNHRVTVYNTAVITNGENAVNVLGQTAFNVNTGATTQPGMNYPRGVAYDATNNRLYVAQANSANRVTVYNVATISNGENAVNVLGPSAFDSAIPASSQSGANSPTGLAIDAANSKLYVSSDYHRIGVYNVSAISNGMNALNVLGQSDFSGSSSATSQPGVYYPNGLALDTTNSRLYVADSSNNRVVAYDVATSASISISGTVYTDEGSTTMGSGRTVAVSVNGAAVAGSTTTASNGTYTISGITVSGGEVFTVYLDGATEKAVTVTRNAGNNLTGINLYQNDLIARCDNSCSLTNANLDTADNNGDADISSIYSVSAGTVTLASGINLYIPASHTYAPGGNVSLSGNFTNAGTYTKATETVTFSASSGTQTFNTGGSSFYNITHSGAGTLQLVTNNLTATGAFATTAGTFDANTKTVAVTSTTTITDSTYTGSTGTNTFTGVLTMTGGTLTTTGAGSVVLGADVTGSASSTTSTISGALNLGGSTRTFTIADGAAANDMSISAVISNGGVTKAGSGRMVVSGNNTYVSATTVSAGVLNVQSATGTGTTAGGVSVTSGAAVELQGTIAVGAEALTLNGTGISTGGALRNISDNNSWSGAITLGSTVRINSDSGTLTLTGSITGTGRALTVGGSGNVIKSTSGINTSTSGTLTKDGSGTLTVSATGSYTGATTVSAGVLNIQHATATGTTAGGVSVTAGAALEVQGGITVGAEAITLNSDGISTGGAFRNISGDNSFSGTITLASASRINSDSGTLTLTGSITGTGLALTVGGSGNVTKTTNGINTSTSGTLIKDGSGTLMISANGSYTGATTVSAGVLNVRSATALGTVAGGVTVASGAALEVQNGAAIGAEAITINGTGISNGGALRNVSGMCSLSGAITLGSNARINSDQDTFTITGGITGTGLELTVGGSGTVAVTTNGINTSTGGTVIKDGSGTFSTSGSGNYTGSTTVSSGVFSLRNASGAGTTASGITVTSGAALELQGTLTFNAEPVTLEGSGISSGGALRNISGNNTYTGPITLSGSTRINSDANTMTLSGGITGTGHALTMGGAGDITVSTSGINTSTSGTLTKDGAGTLTLSATGSYTGATTISEGTVVATANTVLGTTAAGTTIASGATLDFSSVTYSTTEAIALNGGTITASGTSAFGGAITLGADSTITTTAALTANGAISGSYNLVKNGASTLKLGNTFSIGGNFTISAGEFDVSTSNYAVAVGGNWSNSGTFTAQAGTVTLNGTNQTISGSTTFYNLTKSVATAATLTFTAGTTQTITNTLTLNGATGQLLSLRSSSTPSVWTIDPQGTRTISYLDVKDSTNSNVTAVNCATGCTDSTGNTNWTFGSVAPTVDAVTISDTSYGTTVTTVTLTEGTTTTTYIWGTATDTSCEEIDQVSNYALQMYRTDVSGGSACSADDNDCYRLTAATTVDQCTAGGGDPTARYQFEVPVNYFADPTDTGAPHVATNWTARVVATDDTALASTAVTATSEMGSLVALNVTSAISYGETALSGVSTEQTATITNTGNRNMDAEVSGDGDMVCDGIGSIAIGSAKWSLTEAFTYASAGTALTVSAVNVQNSTAQRTGTSTTTPTYWKVQVPSSGVVGSCSNTVTFTAIADV